MHKNLKELKYTSASQQGGCKQNSKKTYYGTTPPQGKYWSGLYPPILLTNIKVTGSTTNMLRKGNQKKWHTCQEEQGPQTYWSTHEVKLKFQAELPLPGKHQNNMLQSGLAVHHPAYETLKRYETEGCPVKLAEIGPKKRLMRQWWGVPTSQLYHNKKLIITLLNQKKKWHRIKHVWYAINVKGDFPT